MAKTTPSLLLLPPPPSPFTPVSFSAAYRPSITAAIEVLKELKSSSQLYVVLPSPSSRGHDVPRSQIYREVQSLVGSVYSLISLVCASLGADVDTDAPGAVDARVILVDYGVTETSSTYHSAPDPFFAGPIVDLVTFSTTRRAWNFLFSVDGEQGQEFLRRYLPLANSISPPLQAQLRVLPGGVGMVQPAIASPRSPVSSARHSVVAVGGTFDHIHAGHKLLLTATALLLQPPRHGSKSSRRLIVGITGDELLKNKKYAEYLKSWKQRQDDVIDFLSSIMSFTRSEFYQATEITSYDEEKPNGRAIHTKLISSLITIECVEIQDPFGPTITDESVTALVVSGETRSGGHAVNEKRVEKGWHPLEVYEVDVLDAAEPGDVSTNTADFASKISSTAIRKRKAERARTSSL